MNMVWVMSICLLLQITIGASVTEYVSSLDVSKFEMSSVSTSGLNDFNLVKDNDVSTGIQSDVQGNDRKQFLRVQISSTGSDVRIGAVFLFVNPSETTSGAIEVHAHSEDDARSSATKCIDFNTGGGVDNCNRYGQYVTIYCSSGCLPALSINMLRITDQSSISAQASLSIAAGNDISDANELSKVHQAGSILSVHPSTLLTISSGRNQYSALVFNFNSGVSYQITTVMIISQDSLQIGWQVRAIDTITDIVSAVGICHTDSVTNVGYLLVADCDQEKPQLVIERTVTIADLSISKIIVFGKSCNDFGPTQLTKEITVTASGAQASLTAPTYTENCDGGIILVSPSITTKLTFKDYSTGSAYSGWISASTGIISTTITQAVYAYADSETNKIKVIIVAEDASNSARTNEEVLWTFILSVQCDSTFNLNLEDPATYATSPFTYGIRSLGYIQNFGHADYTTLCIQASKTLSFSFIGSGASPIGWVTQQSTKMSMAAPQESDYKTNSESTIQVSMVASDGVTQANSQVTLQFVFPNYADLVCPSTVLSPKIALTPYSFEMPVDGSANAEKFYLPLVVDSVSSAKLDDTSGLAGCGPREYTLKDQTDKLQINSLTQAITLLPAMTKIDAGAYTAVVEVKLTNYPQIKMTLSLQITLVVEVIPPPQPDPKPIPVVDPPIEDPDPKPDNNPVIPIDNLEPDNEQKDRSSPECKIERFIEQEVPGLFNDTVRTLPTSIELPGNQYPLKLAFKVPLYVPLPLCGQSFNDVKYSLKQFRQPNSPDWTESWLSLDTKTKQIIIGIDSEKEMPRKIHQVCVEALVAKSSRVKCVIIVPPTIDPFDFEDNKDDGDEDSEEPTKVQIDQEPSILDKEGERELFVDQVELRRKHLALVRQTLPDSELSKNEGLTFKIVKISVKGEVIIKFNQPIFKFDELNNKLIDVAYCCDVDCIEDCDVVKEKGWIESSLIAGSNSDVTKLGLKHSDVAFVDSETLSMQISFESSIDISLNQDEDKLAVKLWGPFLSADNLEPIADKNRIQVKAIPPQLMDDWKTKIVEACIEGNIISSATFSAIGSNMLKKLATKGALSSVLGMITSMQLIVHSPLIGVQFPANAFILYDELIQVTTFEVLPTQDLFPQFMDFPEGREPLNEKFERLDYGDFYSIMLLGTIFLFIVWMVLLYPIYLMLLVCRLRFQWPQNMIKSMRLMLFWKQWSTFSYTFFIEIFICVQMQGFIVYDNWFETSWVSGSFVLWIFCAILLLHLFIITFTQIRPKLTRMEGSRKALKSQYGILVADLDLNRGGNIILYHVSYFIRRIVLVIVTMYWWNDVPMFQVLTVLIVDLLGAVIQAHVWPLKTQTANRFTLYDDFTLCSIISCLTCCTELVNDGNSRYMVGFFIIFITLQNLIVNLVVLLAGPVKRLIMWCKWFFVVRKVTKGKTISYAKRRAKRKLSQHLSGTIEFFTSKEQNESQKSDTSKKDVTVSEIQKPPHGDIKLASLAIVHEQDSKEESDEFNISAQSMPAIQNANFSSSFESKEMIKDNDPLESERLGEQSTSRIMLSKRNGCSALVQPCITEESRQCRKPFKSVGTILLEDEQNQQLSSLCNNILLTDKPPVQQRKSELAVPSSIQSITMSKRRSYKKHDQFTQLLQPMHAFGLSHQRAGGRGSLEQAPFKKKQNGMKDDSNYINEESKDNSSEISVEPDALVADLYKLNIVGPSQLIYDQPVRFDLQPQEKIDKDINSSHSGLSLNSSHIKVAPNLSFSSASSISNAKSKRNVRNLSHISISSNEHTDDEHSSKLQNLMEDQVDDKHHVLSPILEQNSSGNRKANIKFTLASLDSIDNQADFSSPPKKMVYDSPPNTTRYYSPRMESKLIYEDTGTVSCQNIAIRNKSNVMDYPNNSSNSLQWLSDKTERHIGPAKLRVSPRKLKQQFLDRTRSQEQTHNLVQMQIMSKLKKSTSNEK